MWSTDLIIFLFVLTTLFQIRYGKKKHGIYLNPITIFNVIFFLHNWSFSFSQVLGYNGEWNAPGFVHYTTQNSVLIINLISIWAFFLGYIIFLKKPISKIVKKKFEWKIYIYLYILLTSGYVVYNFVNGAFSAVYGSGQGQNAADAYNPIAIIFHARVIFGAISILKYSDHKKIVFGTITVELVLSILLGGRKALIIISSTYLLSRFENHKFRIRRILILSLIALSVLYYSVFISIFRSTSSNNESLKSRLIYAIEESYDNSSNLFFKSINSANSEGIQNWTYQLVQNNELNRTFGMSYVQSMVNTIILRPYQGDLVNYQAAFYFKSVAYPETHNHGWDFSFMAEAFLNWGDFAFFSCFLLGVIISKIFVLRSSSDFHYVLYFILMALLFVNLRTDSTAFMRNISFFLLSFYILRFLNLIRVYKVFKS